VIVIPAGNPSQWTGPTGNNTYLLTGRTPALIDAGVGNPTHIQSIDAALQGRDLQVILLTHLHADHASGVPALLDRWPRAAVRPLSEPLVDGDVIQAGDDALVALHTPGHAPDHFCFLDNGNEDIFCGDLARLGATIVIPGSRGGDLRAYLASLERIRDLRPRRLWPGHGPVVEDPMRLIDEYIEHRKSREAQIIDALRRGRSTPSEIVSDVYRGLPPTLVAAARESVLAHLRKLEEDGVIKGEGKREKGKS
jgi:glyoxylase-like metal-dependent hydrolase (beta-lactamase superfamily II)